MDGSPSASPRASATASVELLQRRRLAHRAVSPLCPYRRDTKHGVNWIAAVIDSAVAHEAGGARLLRIRVRGPAGERLSVGRSVVRLIGLGLAIVPMFAGFVPVLFTERRRGLPDWLAGSVVLYDETPALDPASD
jgi:hypothetical protein